MTDSYRIFPRDWAAEQRYCSEVLYPTSGQVATREEYASVWINLE